MGLTNIGEVSVGVGIPALAASVNANLPDLQAQLDALLAFSPGAIDFNVNLGIAQQMVLDLQAAISAGITPPSIDAQIAAVAAIIGKLQAQIGALVAIAGLLTAKVYIYKYTGSSDQFGPQLSAALINGFTGNGVSETVAIIIGATASASMNALGAIFI